MGMNGLYSEQMTLIRIDGPGEDRTHDLPLTYIIKT